ncbi:Lysophospholipase L1 [Thermoactinomyces sp. DSM 45891]|uniref:SGNH/GDSL hydrolase family protein n=1 Tax=Thermoactinomyces sp. DSM 45891 TaxID=1761907 RepID=UPI0009125883|nr:SGNH/GDSL hydrolase family protein [Thermoactinomyces sp. DSM 45891]SFX09090.1 Lysophospholipase L1 [Thermoactinomyces sp. DSM 45891]
MHSNHRLRWISIFAVAIASFSILLIGSIMSLIELFRPQTSNLQQSASQKAVSPSSPTVGRIVSLGDSLTRGIGDDSGKGYIQLFREQLQKSSKSEVSLVNLSVSGATSTDLRKQISQPETANLLKSAEIIPLTIGGNDLFRGSGRLENTDPETVEKARLTYQENIDFILKDIRKQNSKATIFVFGLYNPFGDLSEAKQTNEFVAQWNQTAQQVIAKYDRVVFIPTYDLFQLEPKRYLFTDHFHPNQYGYQRIANRLTQLVIDQEGMETK